MQKEEMTQKMNAFLARQPKTDAEQRVEARILNGTRKLNEAQSRLQALSKEKTNLEGAVNGLVSQLQAMWDLALEYQAEADTVPEPVAVAPVSKKEKTKRTAKEEVASDPGEIQ